MKHEGQKNYGRHELEIFFKFDGKALKNEKSMKSSSNTKEN